MIILLFVLFDFNFCGERNDKEILDAAITRLYEECKLTARLDYNVYRTAVIGYLNMRRKGLLSDKEIIIVIDYTKSGNDKRFYVIDLDSKKLLYQTLVAHGKNTGNKYAKHFSNEPRTHKSSLGFYVTAETFYSKHGYSMRLDGVDSLFNDNARRRDIIIHGADYVSDEWAKKYGRIGRSWGCPVLPKDMAKEVIDTMKDGCCLFAYFNDKEYLASTKYLKVDSSLLQYLKIKENSK